MRLGHNDVVQKIIRMLLRTGRWSEAGRRRTGTAKTQKYEHEREGKKSVEDEKIGWS